MSLHMLTFFAYSTLREPRLSNVPSSSVFSSLPSTRLGGATGRGGGGRGKPELGCFTQMLWSSPFERRPDYDMRVFTVLGVT